VSAPRSARPATKHPAARGSAGDLRIAGGTSEPEESLAARAERVACVAAKHAAAVDHESRVPAEAIASMRAERLLGAAVSPELGGEGASIGDIVDVCYTLGRACASTAMIFAMHQTKVACIVRHGRTSAWHQRLMRHVVGKQLLLASSTTEGDRGGDLRKSSAPIERHEGRIKLERMATIISYGEIADGIVTTARRSPDAASGDQVLVVFLQDDYTLERQIGWDALGMRGTASSGYKLIASGISEQILPTTYHEILAHTMMPVSHLAWSAAWAGIAAAAVDRARAFVRKAAHRADTTMPPSAAHLTRASASMRTLRSVIAGALRRFELAAGDPAALEAVDFQTGMNLLKVQASELAVATVMSAMQACGLSGYRNDGDFSIGRHLRDVLSSPIMISNDRIVANVGAASLLGGSPPSLRE
jgi:acyl-CoA dehydrogenase